MKILIIENDKDVMEQMRSFLASQKHKVLECQNGMTALMTIEKEDADIVLLDADVPDMSSLELARKIKMKNDVPIIYITTIKTKRSAIVGAEAEIDEFLTKPFLREELLLRVNTVLAAKCHTNILNIIVEKRTRKLKDILHRLSESSRDSILRLLIATEYRDDSTGNHVIRVGKLSYLIAKKLGMRQHILDVIENASQMHDVGKIGIPDSILLKRGKLIAEEFEIMKKHTLIGAGILKSGRIRLIKTAYDIALMHHEKWDGCGYPFSKKGDDIPISARITALSDVFDSLKMDRPYRARLPWELAVEIIRSERGKHFDPQIVDAFLKDIHEIKALYDKYENPIK